MRRTMMNIERVVTPQKLAWRWCRYCCSFFLYTTFFFGCHKREEGEQEAVEGKWLGNLNGVRRKGRNTLKCHNHYSDVKTTTANCWQDMHTPQQQASIGGGELGFLCGGQHLKICTNVGMVPRRATNWWAKKMVQVSNHNWHKVHRKVGKGSGATDKAFTQLT